MYPAIKAATMANVRMRDLNMGYGGSKTVMRLPAQMDQPVHLADNQLKQILHTAWTRSFSISSTIIRKRVSRPIMMLSIASTVQKTW